MYIYIYLFIYLCIHVCVCVWVGTNGIHACAVCIKMLNKINTALVCIYIYICVYMYLMSHKCMHPINFKRSAFSTTSNIKRHHPQKI